MSKKNKKQLNKKTFETQETLITLLIMLIFITMISIAFIKMAKITYEIEKTNQKINQTKQQEKTIINEEENQEEKTQKKYTYNKPEVETNYTPIKFIWTEKNKGYWVKTTEDDKEWYSIEEGIYPTFAYNPQTIKKTFNINGKNKTYDTIFNWDYKIYIWISKSEEIEDKYSELFLKDDKGTLLLYDNGWENDTNQTYNRKQKIDILPSQTKQKITENYQKYITSSENKNIEEIIEEVEQCQLFNTKQLITKQD